MGIIKMREYRIVCDVSLTDKGNGDVTIREGWTPAASFCPTIYRYTNRCSAIMAMGNLVSECGSFDLDTVTNDAVPWIYRQYNFRLQYRDISEWREG